MDFDQHRADLLPTLINFLRAEPDFTEVAQELTMRFLREFNARWVHFGLVHDDASLQPLGSFGLSAEAVEALDRASIWSPLPMAEAVRCKESVVVVADSLDAQQVPAGSWIEGYPPSIASVPLTTSTKTLGVMTVGFHPEASVGAPLVHYLEAMADLLVLYISSWVVPKDGAQPLVVDEPEPLRSRKARAEQRSGSITPELTRRQKTILVYLGEGLTYDQIGARIGFSHSTVRMDLMQIYRFFGVTSRDAAVAVALERGLLDHRSIDEDVCARLGASRAGGASSSGSASSSGQFDH